MEKSFGPVEILVNNATYGEILESSYSLKRRIDRPEKVANVLFFWPPNNHPGLQGSYYMSVVEIVCPSFVQPVRQAGGRAQLAEELAARDTPDSVNQQPLLPTIQEYGYALRVVALEASQPVQIPRPDTGRVRDFEGPEATSPVHNEVDLNSRACPPEVELAVPARISDPCSEVLSY